MRKHTIHKTDVVLDRESLDSVMFSKDLDFVGLHDSLVTGYGIDLTYKGFMSLISNRSSWKLIYAVVLIDYLGVELDSIFHMIDIDIDKKLEEKRAWVKKYQREIK